MFGALVRSERAMTGHREYSHRRPELFKTPYLIATYAGNAQATYAHNRFHKHERENPEHGPSAQERFEAAVARWHKDNPS